MQFEPIWKPVTTLKEIPYEGTFLANFNSSLGIQTTFKHGNSLYGYVEQTLPTEYCKIPEDNEVFAEFVSETFISSGFLLHDEYQLEIDWKEYSYSGDISNYIPPRFKKTLLQPKGICKIEITTTISIQGHLFTNVSETIEFIGELTKSQKNTLWKVSGLRVSLEDFENEFQDFLDEKYQMSEISYEADSRWDNFVEIEYNENYSEYM